MGENNTKISDFFSFDGTVHGFFIVFFSVFISKFGITNLILDSSTNWNIIFNVGVWFVLISFCANRFFDAADNKKQRRLKEVKK